MNLQRFHLSIYLSIYNLYYIYIYLLTILIQPVAIVTAVNPQRCVPYFTVHIPVYHEDTTIKLIDRIRRISQIPGLSGHLSVCWSICPSLTIISLSTGNIGVTVWYYLNDARSIPITGEETKGLELVPLSGLFQVQNGNVSFSDLNSDSDDIVNISIGSHTQYLVDM